MGNLGRFVYLVGRFGQLLGMWLLLVDLFTAGPGGPSFNLFAAGVVVFLAGWGLTRVVKSA
jgi:hypothetical protein